MGAMPEGPLYEIPTEDLLTELRRRHDAVVIGIVDGPTDRSVRARVVLKGDLAWQAIAAREVQCAVDAAIGHAIPTRRDFHVE